MRESEEQLAAAALRQVAAGVLFARVAGAERVRGVHGRHLPLDRELQGRRADHAAGEDSVPSVRK